MRLLRVHIISADSCGGLLDGLDVHFRSPYGHSTDRFHPFCLIGPDFLKKTVFKMLYKQCNEGNQRLINQMKDMVSPLP